MKQLVPVFLLIAASAWAADFWQAKPFTDWNDKEIQKLFSNSPWSKEVALSMAGGGGASKGRRGSGGDSPMSGPANGRGDAPEFGTPSSDTSLTLVVSWRTALPIREAAAKQKFGDAAATKPEAKQMVEDPQKYYAILVSGLPGGVMRSSESLKDMLLKGASLSAKGKGPIMATNLEAVGGQQKGALLFLFPKTTPFDVDDKEVDFAAKMGEIIVKAKFRLKEMVFNGKLEL